MRDPELFRSVEMTNNKLFKLTFCIFYAELPSSPPPDQNSSYVDMHPPFCHPSYENLEPSKWKYYSYKSETFDIFI